MNTPSYEPRLHGQTNKTSDPVANCAAWNVDQEQEVKRLSERVEWAVSRLLKDRDEFFYPEQILRARGCLGLPPVPRTKYEQADI
ncbi:hypothetical protein O0555_18990 [Brevibacillus laterosporus]|uniref:hypothetical protein n=1 Tax=Brevibacillus laterosporus TaxID=1465 RepID=UPI0018CE3450|nr:hypothetical protein [Brevibacillus laterosporus]MCR8939400.1 hypothetical protein [Brevibacillus laterosporus]MCZ0842040.1 hypothetical protein [Brevibacillus laterosporus]MCZ0847244.1 hypothetical protein [Brevibacillus laterosporus]MED1910342.1 hypothetical protein [Brevibacillus laterosporus]